MLKGRIELTGMSFFARHGCLEEERLNGNTFKVDFSGTCDITAAAESDRLEDTVDYGEIYGIIRAEMERPSALLENVATRIVGALGAAFPQMSEISVSVSKKNPPVGGECEWSKVSIIQ